MSKVIKDIEKNKKDILRVEVSEFKGYHFAQIRIWFKDESDVLRPTQKGVTIPTRAIPEIIQALEAAHKELLNEGGSNSPDGGGNDDIIT